MDSSGASVLPKDTLARRLQEQEIKQPTIWLKDNPLHLLSHNHPDPTSNPTKKENNISKKYRK